jgi:hypothetical protein
MIDVLGAAARTARMRLSSSDVPTLTLSKVRPALARACAAMTSGSPSEMVKAVVSGCGVARPSMAATEVPARLASRSQSAQSTAFRAAPGGMALCRSWREMPRSTSGRTASICSATLSIVSP